MNTEIIQQIAKNIITKHDNPQEDFTKDTTEKT